MTVGLNSLECLQSLTEGKINVNETTSGTGQTSTTTPAATSSTSNVAASSTSTSSMTNLQNAINKTANSCEMLEPMAAPSSTTSATTITTSTTTTSAAASSTPTNNDLNNNHIHSTQSLGALKKLRAPPKSGRNHAGAKYLASQYTQSRHFRSNLNT